MTDTSTIDGRFEDVPFWPESGGGVLDESMYEQYDSYDIQHHLDEYEDYLKTVHDYEWRNSERDYDTESW